MDPKHKTNTCDWTLSTDQCQGKTYDASLVDFYITRRNGIPGSRMEINSLFKIKQIKGKPDIK